MCYRDMTFCPYHGRCVKGKTCPNALGDKVIEDAKKWWGGEDAPICVYAAAPDCYEERHVL